jgi:hypothetical protein
MKMCGTAQIERLDVGERLAEAVRFAGNAKTNRTLTKSGFDMRGMHISV